jgi:hypothetical protein
MRKILPFLKIAIIYVTGPCCKMIPFFHIRQILATFTKLLITIKSVHSHYPEFYEWRCCIFHPLNKYLESTTCMYVVSANPVHDKVYSMQHYMIKFVIDLRQVSGFLWVSRFPPPRYTWNICDKVCQWLATGQCFSPGTPVSSTNKTYHHDITEILLKVALNIITPHLLYDSY